MHRFVTIAMAGLVMAWGCDDEEEAIVDTEPAGEQAEATPAEEPAEEPAAEEPCPEQTELTVNGVEGVSLAPPTTEFADVTLNRSADLVFTSYEMEADPQFGLSAPVGVPDVPEGGYIFTIKIQAPEQLAVGQYQGEEPEAEGLAGRVYGPGMYKGSDRIFPDDHSVRLTEIAEDHLCGEVIPPQGSDDPTVSGRFRIPIED